MLILYLVLSFGAVLAFALKGYSFLSYAFFAAAKVRKTGLPFSPSLSS